MNRSTFNAITCVQITVGENQYAFREKTTCIFYNLEKVAALITEFAVPTFQHLGRKRLHSACQFGFVNTLVFNLITALSCAPWFFHFVRFKPMRTSFSAFTADVSFLASVMLIFDQYYKFSEAMQRPVCNQRFAVISAPPGKTL